MNEYDRHFHCLSLRNDLIFSELRVDLTDDR